MNKKKKTKKQKEDELHEKILKKTLKSIGDFKQQFRKQISIGIGGAFAFLIASIWKIPIQNTVNLMIEKLNLIGHKIIIEYISAIVVTVICVIGLIMISKWSIKK